MLVNINIKISKKKVIYIYIYIHFYNKYHLKYIFKYLFNFFFFLFFFFFYKYSVIFNLYAAFVYPIFFSKYHKAIRPYVYTFAIVYNAIFILIALYEPLFIGYSMERIENSHNCSFSYRYRLYQYI